MSKIEELKTHLKNETKLAKVLRYLYMVVIVVGFLGVRSGYNPSRDAIIQGDDLAIYMVFLGFCLFIFYPIVSIIKRDSKLYIMYVLGGIMMGLNVVLGFQTTTDEWRLLIGGLPFICGLLVMLIIYTPVYFYLKSKHRNK